MRLMGSAFQKLLEMLLNHLDGILNYCRTKVPMGVVDAVNGNIKTLLGGGRGPRNLRICFSKLSGWMRLEPNCRFQESRLIVNSVAFTEP